MSFDKFKSINETIICQLWNKINKSIKKTINIRKMYKFVFILEKQNKPIHNENKKYKKKWISLFIWYILNILGYSIYLSKQIIF